MRPVALSSRPCTSTTAPVATAARPPARLSSNTVLLVTSTPWPSTVRVPAAALTASTGPVTRPPKRSACARAVAVVVSTALLSISTRMPRRSALSAWAVPLSSVTVQLLSSKRTPLTITEPKPVIVPWVKAVAVGGVSDALALSSPPPPPQAVTSSRAESEAASRPRAGVNRRCKGCIRGSNRRREVPCVSIIWAICTFNVTENCDQWQPGRRPGPEGGRRTIWPCHRAAGSPTWTWTRSMPRWNCCATPS